MLKATTTFVALLSASLILSGCSGYSSKSDSRYSIKQDRGPDSRVDLSKVPDAVPKVEPKSRGGNKSTYTVWGKKYHVMANSAGYRQRGSASWYGKKFHGHKTSNGETYDMYAMSAAHTSLPLPTYARVTNLDNGKSVIVRVNDRGPFHGSRLIDLSYAAAFRLDMLRKGTARVEVEAINPSTYSTTALAHNAEPVPEPRALEVSSLATNYNSGQYIQVGAYSSWTSAQSVKTQLESVIADVDIIINKREGTNPLYRVQMGPVDHLGTLNGLYNVLRTAGFGETRVVDLP